MRVSQTISVMLLCVQALGCYVYRPLPLDPTPSSFGPIRVTALDGHRTELVWAELVDERLVGARDSSGVGWQIPMDSVRHIEQREVRGTWVATVLGIGIAAGLAYLVFALRILGGS